MSEQAITFLRTLANITYGVSLSEALTILDAAALINPVVFDWNKSSLEQKVTEAKKNPLIMQHIGGTYETSKKIQAIKELRTVSGMGLKESKDVIDAIVPPRVNKERSCCYSWEGGSHSSFCYNY